MAHFHPAQRQVRLAHGYVAESAVVVGDTGLRFFFLGVLVGDIPGGGSALTVDHVKIEGRKRFLLGIRVSDRDHQPVVAEGQIYGRHFLAVDQGTGGVKLALP